VVEALKLQNLPNSNLPGSGYYATMTRDTFSKSHLNANGKRNKDGWTDKIE
jgi:hypothetical protein